MEKLEVIPTNHTYIRIRCSQGVAWELRDRFTFKVPNYQFNPLYKSRIWDGNIRLFDVRDHRIYRGLIPEIEKFCQERQYELEANCDLENEFSLKEAQEYIKDIQLPHIPRDYQTESFVHAIRNKRAVFVSPTASGKSLIIYLITRYLNEKVFKKNILIIVPTVGLVNQLANDFEEYGYDSNEYVHKIFSGKDKNTSKPITISTWQSLQNMSKGFFKNFDAVIGDEAHHFKAKQLCFIMEACINADYRIGTTGTLDGHNTNKLTLQGLFGSVKQVSTSKELMERGYIAELEIKCLSLKHDESNCKSLVKSDYKEEIDYLVNHKGRNNFIKNLSLSLKQNTLVLFNFIDHGKHLYDIINSETNNRAVFLIFGDTHVDVREEVRKIVEKEKNAIIIASFGTFSTGINIRNLFNIIFASPSKSRIRNLQSIGRSLRTTDKKTTATLFDISDDLRWKKYKNYTLKHFEERIKVYTEEKFKFKVYKIQLRGN